MSNVLLTLLVLLVLAVLGILVAVYLRLRSPEQDTQVAVLSEKLSQLSPVAQTVSDIQLNLAELQSHLRARQELESRTAESVRRLETVIAGTQTKGAAGENILEAVFAQLPVEWQIRDFKVGNKTVEFALRLPNNLVLPIDSKWAATNMIEQFATCDDVTEQQRLKKQIETAVLNQAREVKKYIDPNRTVSFGVAVVPDAAYDLCGGIHADIFKLDVVVISYSMFVPYLLLVFQTTLKTTQSIDLQKLDAYLQSVEQGIETLQDEIDGRFSKATTMLSNSRNDMTAQLSKINSGLNGLRTSASTDPTQTGELIVPEPDARVENRGELT